MKSIKNDKTISETAAVVAIVRNGNRLQAVMLRKQDGAFELVWTKVADINEKDWKSFADECMSSVSRAEKEPGGEKIIVGFDSSSVIFYLLDVPAVNKGEIAEMVKFQAEVRLPLPAAKMELGFRVGRAENGQVAVTMAAARTEQLQKFVEEVRWFKPSKIMLDAEGIVESWRRFFYGNGQAALIISIGERDTKICVTEEGRLSNSASLDMGTEDFPAPDDSIERTEAIERFTQDIRSVLGLFGYAEPVKIPIFVLSDGGRFVKSIVSHLCSAGFNVRAALPNVRKITTGKVIGAAGIDEVYEYRAAIGLAAMALAAGSEEINIFERLYNTVSKTKRRLWHSLRATGTLAVVMLVLLVIVFYLTDVASVKAIERRIGKSHTQGSYKLFMERQKLIKAAAGQRPDMLELLEKVNCGDIKGITLDSFSFKKGRPVSIRGHVDGNEQLYSFQNMLLGKSGISNVKIQSAAKSNKGEKLKFTITFDYKRFTEKKR